MGRRIKNNYVEVAQHLIAAEPGREQRNRDKDALMRSISDVSEALLPSQA